MKELKQSLEDLRIDSSWTLFLDRDGVINHRLPGDYVKSIDSLNLIAGSLEAIAQFSKLFGRIVIVTNQQGIGKGLYTHEDLTTVHDYLQSLVTEAGGKIDGIFYCPHLATEGCQCRKPRPGMAFQAKQQFPEIEFHKSFLVGDSPSDIAMGNSVGMKTVWVNGDRPGEKKPKSATYEFSDLRALAHALAE